jgi:hypothetical protein
LKQLFKSLFDSHGFENDGVFDWNIMDTGAAAAAAAAVDTGNNSSICNT